MDWNVRELFVLPRGDGKRARFGRPVIRGLRASPWRRENVFPAARPAWHPSSSTPAATGSETRTALDTPPPHRTVVATATRNKIYAAIVVGTRAHASVRRKFNDPTPPQPQPPPPPPRSFSPSTRGVYVKTQYYIIMYPPHDGSVIRSIVLTPKSYVFRRWNKNVFINFFFLDIGLSRNILYFSRVYSLWGRDIFLKSIYHRYGVGTISLYSYRWFHGRINCCIRYCSTLLNDAFIFIII